MPFVVIKKDHTSTSANNTTLKNGIMPGMKLVKKITPIVPASIARVERGFIIILINDVLMICNAFNS